jgi:hypothetical protein
MLLRVMLTLIKVRKQETLDRQMMEDIPWAKLAGASLSISQLSQ